MLKRMLKNSVYPSFNHDSQLSVLGSCFTMLLTALKRISSVSSVSVEKSKLPVGSTIGLGSSQIIKTEI